MNLFDIFKGRKNKKGHVLKIRSIGHGYYDEDADFCELEINGLEKDGYTLEPETDVNSNHDYVIFYENLESEELEKVGVGYLLHGKNAGLIRLEWDFYDSSSIYINLARYKTSETVRMAA
jgi:hypothetical protein